MINITSQAIFGENIPAGNFSELLKVQCAMSFPSGKNQVHEFVVPCSFVWIKSLTASSVNGVAIFGLTVWYHVKFSRQANTVGINPDNLAVGQLIPQKDYSFCHLKRHKVYVHATFPPQVQISHRHIITVMKRRRGGITQVEATVEFLQGIDQP